MKLNSKGFSISGILYPLFLIMLVFVTLILLVLINSKFALDKKKNEIVKDISGEGVVCAYTNWMTEEELTSEGKNVDDSDVQNRTEYAYQDIASWSDTYIESKPNDGYYKEKKQYRSVKKTTYSQREWTMYDNDPTCGSICNSNCDSYSAAHMSSTTSWPRQCVCRTCVKCDESGATTEWSDTQVSTGCSVQTRTVYATPIWADIDETKWNPESIYEATDTRRIVTRTTYRYFKCER